MMETAYLLNPPRHRKVRRVKSRARRRRNSWPNDSAGHARAARKGWRRRRASSKRRKSNPTRRSYRRRRAGGRRRNNPVHRIRRRRGSRRRRNPGVGAMSLTRGVPQIVPVKLPLPGIVGDIANGIVQGAIGGAVVFVGYHVSGVIVDKVEKMMGDTLAGKFRRPVLFAATAGVIGGLVSMIAPKGKRGLFALLAAAGPGLRAAAGFLTNIVGRPAEVGFMQSAWDSAKGLSDYIQVGELYEAGMGDYIQVGDDEDATGGAMEELYEAGMGEEEDVFATA
jgi:hypothetical protein